MSALLNPLFTAAGRQSRRKVFLIVAGIAVAIYILAPFCWLLLTSFMHERDALTVPTQWIPRHPTLEHYEMFFHPSGTSAIVGGRAAEEMLPGMLNSLIAALGTAVSSRSSSARSPAIASLVCVFAGRARFSVFISARAWSRVSR